MSEITILPEEELKGSIEAKFYKYQKYQCVIPVELKALYEVLVKSEGILNLGENWDNEGSMGYTFDTWFGFASFLVKYALEIYRNFNLVIDTPKVYPGPNGSIDVDWETNTYGLLVNIAKGGEVATYYADYKPAQMTEGTFNPLDFKVHLLPFAVAI